MQFLRSNKSLHFASVEDPPVEAVELIFQQGARFFCFSDTRAAVCSFFPPKLTLTTN
jgi:hypothetical protein